MNTDFIRSMGKRENGFVIILDADLLFGASDLAGVSGSLRDPEGPGDSGGSADPETGVGTSGPEASESPAPG